MVDKDETKRWRLPLKSALSALPACPAPGRLILHALIKIFEKTTFRRFSWVNLHVLQIKIFSNTLSSNVVQVCDNLTNGLYLFPLQV